MTSRTVVRTFLIFALMIGCLFTGFGVDRASAATQVIFQEDWELGGPDWWVDDLNSNSGYDYWEVTTYRAHGGSYSLWCAQVGTYSGNGIANSVNHYYDQDMESYCEYDLPDISGYNSASISFYYWAVTGTFSMVDYFDVWVWNSVSWTPIWTQSDVNSGGWQLASASIPLDSIWVEFDFWSDSTVGLGPYEGVYIDDIVITATDSVAPVSSVGSLNTHYPTSTISIPYSASDAGSGMDYTELYYQKGTSGGFTRYTTVENPTGHWASSPIAFNSSLTGGNGLYQFYTRATDNYTNVESAPGGYDASTIIDTVLPSTLIDFTGTVGNNGWYCSSVTITLVASDVTSGVANTKYRIDSGSWQIYGSSFNYSTPGNHTIEYNSTDAAGNLETTKNESLKIDVVNPSLVIITANDTLFTSNAVEITYTSTDNVSGLDVASYILDSGTPVSCSNGVISLSGLNDGTHTLKIRASDNAGNVIEKTMTFKVDTSVFSMSGPMGPWLDVILIILIIVAISIFLLVKRRKNSIQQSPPKGKPADSSKNDVSKWYETGKKKKIEPSPPKPADNTKINVSGSDDGKPKKAEPPQRNPSDNSKFGVSGSDETGKKKTPK
jgi:hypothetical protein